MVKQKNKPTFTKDIYKALIAFKTTITKMHIDIITLFPDVFPPIFEHSILKRAQSKKKFSYSIHNLRDYSQNKHKRVDDYPFGGSPGMVIQIEPVVNCLEKLQAQKKYDEIIYLAPDGELLTQNLANELAIKENLILLCGHYKGIDERIRTHFITREISIGDYVLSGGELAAMVLTDAVIRLLPGVLGDETSALQDSYQDGLVDAPVYTRPAVFRGIEVPPILLSGNEKAINQWQHEQAVARTKAKRPNLL